MEREQTGTGCEATHPGSGKNPLAGQWRKLRHVFAAGRAFVLAPFGQLHRPNAFAALRR